jgi:hypothetical protein
VANRPTRRDDIRASWLSPAIGALCAWPLHFSRQHQAAADLCLEMLKLDPDFFLAHICRALAFEAQSKYQEAWP